MYEKRLHVLRIIISYVGDPNAHGPPSFENPPSAAPVLSTAEHGASSQSKHTIKEVDSQHKNC